jgi:hypothetical protein
MKPDEKTPVNIPTPKTVCGINLGFIYPQIPPPKITAFRTVVDPELKRRLNGDVETTP